MALPALADLATFRQWPGVTVRDGDEQSAELVLAAASSALRRRAGKTWVDTDGKLAGVPDGLDLVAVAAAARFWINPEGRSLLQAGAESEQWAGVVAGIAFTDDELATIAAAAGRGGLWTLQTQRDDCVSASWWDPSTWPWVGP
ncbi:MAG TPA: hypothetical protein VFL65_00830 [Jatrophihabitans sp.]|nr:hypothetical protein [Jatrophihabitans sp.]